LISVKHASKKAHLSSHQEFFNALEKEAKLSIAKENLWLKKDIMPYDRKDCCSLKNCLKIPTGQ
jgi:hypothetical protein